MTLIPGRLCLGLYCVLLAIVLAIFPQADVGTNHFKWDLVNPGWLVLAVVPALPYLERACVVAVRHVSKLQVDKKMSAGV